MRLATNTMLQVTQPSRSTPKGTVRNSIVLPGVTLGPRTIVGAGSVVTKPFPEGNCIIAGNPARVIKNLNESRNTP
jgi:bifunctional N-acetylglucosamine-1-phosphate-uridyltransferase/glucosamine-1-phosphate-acetyltransferase GlmU-like protein